LAEIAGEYLKKGSQVYIEGKLQTRKWQDKEGKDRYTTEVIVNEMTMLGGKQDDNAERAPSNKAKPAGKTPPPAKENFDNFDDEPF